MITHPNKNFDDFNKVLKNLCYFVCEYGIERCKPSKGDRLQQIKFYHLVHEGWKKAQDLAVKELLDIQDEMSEIKRKIKNHNRKGNRKHAKELKAVINLLQGRRLRIQFSVNAIGWTIFSCKHHIIHRFFLNKNILNIDKYSLFKTLEFVDQENKDPNKCAICCDLTTFMHVGDVLMIDLSNTENPITLVELKEGKINDKCLDVLNQFYRTGCLRNLYINTLDFNKDEIKQLFRMGRQEWRQTQVMSAITTGEGVDISTESKLTIPEEDYIIDSYEPLILEMYSELSDEKMWSIRDVDSCLFLGLYNDIRLAESAFPIWMKEIEVDSPVWNYQSVFNVSVARPPFSLLFPPDFLKKLVTGEVILKMCLHVPFWIKMVNKTYNVFMRLETVKKSRKFKIKPGDLFKHHNQLIKIKIGETTSYIGSGILSKILFDFYRPIDALRPLFTDPSLRMEGDSQ